MVDVKDPKKKKYETETHNVINTKMFLTFHCLCVSTSPWKCPSSAGTKPKFWILPAFPMQMQMQTTKTSWRKYVMINVLTNERHVWGEREATYK